MNSLKCHDIDTSEYYYELNDMIDNIIKMSNTKYSVYRLIIAEILFVLIDDASCANEIRHSIRTKFDKISNETKLYMFYMKPFVFKNDEQFMIELLKDPVSYFARINYSTVNTSWICSAEKNRKFKSIVSTNFNIG